jgi:hypothetical protein
MSDKRQDPLWKPDPDEPKQTTPKGLEIPVPKRKTVMDALQKIAKPKKDQATRS